MALEVSAAQPLLNGIASTSSAQQDALIEDLLRLRDAVVAGTHASFKLPAAAVEALKASLSSPHAGADGDAAQGVNGVADNDSVAANKTQPTQPAARVSLPGLPGLNGAPAPPANSTRENGTSALSSGGLDPIFLQKSDSLVRAEGVLKRQRIEKALQTQADQRKHSVRDRDAAQEALSHIDVDAVLRQALEIVKPVSGLEPDAASTSFDENDYYSSQVQSDWSSDASSKNSSDRAAGAFTGDFERLDGAAATSTSARPAPATRTAEAYTFAGEDDDMYEPEDDDDDYIPPDPSAYDPMVGIQGTERQADPGKDDNSDYEPGEVLSDREMPTSNGAHHRPAHSSPYVPFIRNHLTHLAAPQPNRVSPLATAKGPSYELELVNGSPQVVQRPSKYQVYNQSRASTASPSGNNANGSGKKKRIKKRKRDQEPLGRSKRRRDKQNPPSPAPSPPSQSSYIKNEPVSPPPHHEMPPWNPYAATEAPTRYEDANQIQYVRGDQRMVAQETPRSGLRYEYAQPPATAARIVSPAPRRPVARDNQDLRRVASLNYIQRAPSPPKDVFSPVTPYRNRYASTTYGEQRPREIEPQVDRIGYAAQYGQPSSSPAHYSRSARSRSPPRLQAYHDPYAETPSPATLMPPPPRAPPPRVIVDQYGTKYIQADPAPEPVFAQPYAPRASVAPVETYRQSEGGYERVPSRMSVAYAQPSSSVPHYAPAGSHMPPPPPPAAPLVTLDDDVDYVDENGVSIREYLKQSQRTQYVPAPASPMHQPARTYAPMPPPPAREPTSPVYAPMRAEPTSPAYAPMRAEPTSPAFAPPRAEPTSPAYAPLRHEPAPAYAPVRSYSVRPEETLRVPSYVRHGSVAPVQYVRQEPVFIPARAVSVMPADHGATAQMAPPLQRPYSQAPQSMRYVDQYGNEVHPQQVSALRYQ